MKQNNKVFAKRSGLLSAATLSLLLALGGCGGGGGGGGAGLAPAPIVVPTLEQAGSGDVDGFVAPYALDPATPEYRSVPQDIVGTGSVNGQFTITVADIDLPDGNPEPGFDVTFDLAGSGSILNPSPLDGLCTNCLRSVDLPASGADPGDPLVTIIYLDPNSQGFDLNFSTLGMWSKPTTVPSNWSEVGGPFSAGVTANGALLPSTGNARYDGFFIGRYATSVPETGKYDAGTYLVGANARADVNFGAGGGVTFSTSDTQISGPGLATPVAESRLDITTTALPINRNNASFGGTPGNLGAGTNGFGMSGEIAGGFYGPPGGAISAPQELGGAVAVGDAERSMVGSFGLKQQ